MLTPEDKKLKRTELEFKLVSSILAKGSPAFEILGKLGFNEDCIEDTQSRALYQSMKQFYDEGERIIIDVLPNPEFVKGVMNLEVDKDAVRFIAKQIWDMKVSKDIEALFLNSSRFIDQDNNKIIGMLEEFLDEYNDSLYSKEKVHTLSSCYSKAEAYQNDDSAIGIEPPIKGINDILGNGELILIGARPSIGKTATAISMMAEMCRKGKEKQQLFFSLEQGDLQVYHRLLSNLTGISHSIIKRKKMSEGQKIKYKKFGEGLKKKNNLHICDESPNKASIEYIKVVAKSLYRKHNIEIIFLDYIQLVKSRKKFPSRREELEHITNELKSLAKELNIPIVILSQLNRDADAYKKKGESTLPKLGQIKDCGSIEQAIDQAYLLHRESKEDNYIKLYHAKNRDGSAGKVTKVSFELHTQIIGKEEVE